MGTLKSLTFRRILILLELVFLSGLCWITPLSAQKTVTDIDGNVYHTVRIGKQVWMAANLKTTRYRNGDSIGTKTRAAIQKFQRPYENMESNVAVYGRLYSGYVVADSRKIAPEGWHIPTDADWIILIDYLGGKDVAGGKMRERGTKHWLAPNTGATNKSGFTALPGGHDLGSGIMSFSSIGLSGCWWSSTQADSTVTEVRSEETAYIVSVKVWSYYLNYNNDEVVRLSIDKACAFSVRCIKD